MQQHVQDTSGESRKSRERAITLAGDEPKLPSTVTATATPAMMPPTADPPSLAWRASTGRHDLSQRQLIILREMLNHPDGTLRIPEEVAVNRAWRWGDGMNSTITLPSEESSAAQVPASPTKKRKMGMSALRDMLRALKRTHPASAPSVPHTSDASASTESSIGDGDGQHYYSHPQILTQRRRVKTSTGPEDQKHAPPSSSTPPYHPPSLTHRASPRRPSLASIFRLGQKSKSTLSGPDTSMDSIANGKNGGKHSDQSSTTEEEDWDCMDSASDFEHAAQALEAGDGMLTVKGKKGRSPYEQEQSLQPGLRPTTPRMGAAASRSSIFGGRDASPHRTRSTRLSNVEENTDDQRGSRALRKGKKRASLPVPSPTRPRSRNGLMSDSVRSAPPQSFATHDPQSISEFKLAMTPENIKPLLENAREVHTRLVECIAELRVLLAAAKP
jgi:serine/arginine repetitive matrix protein 2